MSSVFVFLLIFLCASMEFHYAFTSSSPNLTHIPPASLDARVFVSNYFSSPGKFSQTFLPLATTKNFLFRLLPVSPEELVFHITLQAPVGWGLARHTTAS